MSLGFILIQLLGLVPSVIAFTSLQTGNRKRILALMLFCNIMWLVHYMLLNAYAGVMINVVGLLRAVLCYNNDKKWAESSGWELLLILLYVGGTVLTWEGPLSALPAISMILTTIGLWTHDMRKTRMLFLLNSPPLIFYNIMIHSYSCFFIECCAFISYIIAVYRFDVKKYKVKALAKQKDEILTED